MPRATEPASALSLRFGDNKRPLSGAIFRQLAGLTVS